MHQKDLLLIPSQEGFVNHSTQQIYHTIVDSNVVNDTLSDECAFQRAIGDPSLVPMWPMELPITEFFPEVDRSGVFLLERTDTKSRFNVQMPTRT